MAKTLSISDPNLRRAAARFRRVTIAWAALLGGLGVISLLAQQGRHPLAALVYFVAAGLLLFDLQPVHLAMTAVLWGFSLTALLPGVNSVLASDPIGLMFGVGFLESLALAIVRLLLLILCWSQFMFYRMLYGTAGTVGLDADLPVIPELIPNRTDRLVYLAWALLGLSALALAMVGLNAEIALLSYSLSTPAIGISLGVAFSPTQRRGMALTGLLAGVIVFLISLQMSSTLAG